MEHDQKDIYVILRMVDADGQPIARENYGLNGKPERTLTWKKRFSDNDYMSEYFRNS